MFFIYECYVLKEVREGGGIKFDGVYQYTEYWLQLY